MIDEIMADTKIRMTKSIAAVKVELAKIRTGRATPALLDHVVVSYYGNDVPLNQAATISVSDARTLSVQAWEKESYSGVAVRTKSGHSRRGCAYSYSDANRGKAPGDE